MMGEDFRYLARKHLAAATAEIAANEDQRLRYAALELRSAIEAITYDRAKAYEKELPASVYETWQPKKLMELLIEEDPNAGKNSALAAAREDKAGNTIEPFRPLGSETVFSLKNIRDHYDALGSYLHTPTVKQLRSGQGHNYVRLRSRCDQIVAELTAALGSSIFNVTLGVFSTLDCTRCNQEIRKRTGHLKQGETLKAYCHSCDAPYIVTATENDMTMWKSVKHPIVCPNPQCAKPSDLWEDQIKDGQRFRCIHCDARAVLDVGYCASLIPEA